jgi:molybdenum cofactor cytidylyltransferase
MTNTRHFAIIPAAGLSRRMGTSKLLLPVDGKPLLERVLVAWATSAVAETVVVVRKDDEPLVQLCRRFPIVTVEADPAPVEMRDSIELGLEQVESQFAPADDDTWLVAPADMPHLTAQAIDQVIARYRPAHGEPLVASTQGQCGHPVLLPWRLVAELRALPRDQGLNTLVGSLRARMVDTGDQGVTIDIDTPADYRQLKQEQK